MNELLLCGACYTTINNDNKTPLELTSDDQVRELIWKASKGFIAVRSYSSLTRRYGSASQKEVSSLGVITSAEIGSTAGGKESKIVASSSPSSSVCGKMSPRGESIGSEVDTGGLAGSGLVMASKLKPSESGLVVDVSKGPVAYFPSGSVFAPASPNGSVSATTVSLLGVSVSSCKGEETLKVTPGGSCEEEIDKSDCDIFQDDLVEHVHRPQHGVKSECQGSEVVAGESSHAKEEGHEISHSEEEEGRTSLFP